MILKELLKANCTFNKNKIIIFDIRENKTYFSSNLPKELLDRQVLTFKVLNSTLYIRIY